MDRIARIRVGVLAVSTVLLAALAIACAPASPAGQSEEPTAKPEPAATATPEPELTATPQPTPDPAKLAPEAHTLIALRDAIAAREEAANSQGDGARSAPEGDQPPINFGVPIPTTLEASISTIAADSVETFLTDNGGTVIERRDGPTKGLNPAPVVATVVVAEFPTTLLEDLARQDDVLYVLLTDGLYPRIGSGLREEVMERAKELLTSAGRAAPTPEPMPVSVYATDEGYDNIREFLTDNGWDFSRDPLYLDFDLIAPISAIPGVLQVTGMPSSSDLMIMPPTPPTISMDLPTSAIGDGAAAHGVLAWHDAGFDGEGSK